MNITITPTINKTTYEEGLFYLSIIPDREYWPT